VWLQPKLFSVANKEKISVASGVETTFACEKSALEEFRRLHFLILEI
jgi:hypothetical protein